MQDTYIEMDLTDLQLIQILFWLLLGIKSFFIVRVTYLLD